MRISNCMAVIDEWLNHVPRPNSGSIKSASEKSSAAALKFPERGRNRSKKHELLKISHMMNAARSRRHSRQKNHEAAKRTERLARHSKITVRP